ncbi:MAG: sigma-70 family RNA polymerase sigma factor [Anaerolinea sp.]|nr:sigma-70 family RNA polymerase sigma factor [Anaerolinea sp.]
MSMHGGTPTRQDQWAVVVKRIKRGDQAAIEDLYNYFARGVRLLLFRQLGPEHLDDRVHDIFLAVLESIRNGTLHSPDRLPGFIRTVVRRHVATAINRAVDERRDQLDITEQWSIAGLDLTPEQHAICRERAGLIRRTLEELSGRDREILTRFYLYEQTAEQICDEMGLNSTQFRLLKSRAKARFGEHGRRKFQSSTFREFLLRKTAGSGD